ncbi:Uncharacterised protein [Campylobacter geochelonis]|nr:Uncharacterised protein [Campylobacter geochelonis]
MRINEYELKNTSYKKTEITLSNIEIVVDAIKKFVYANYKGSCFTVDFLAK